MIKSQTIWVVFTLVMSFGWTIRQLDVKNVLLHGHLRKLVVYMKSPPVSSILIFSIMFVGSRRRSTNSNRHLEHGCIWLFSLYIYVYYSSMILSLVYVDDIIVCNSDASLPQDLIRHLSFVFDIKGFEDLHYLLGIKTHFTRMSCFYLNLSMPSSFSTNLTCLQPNRWLHLLWQNNITCLMAMNFFMNRPYLDKWTMLHNMSQWLAQTYYFGKLG